MPRAIGANCRLLMSPEATYGTAPAGGWMRLPFLSCDLGAEQPLLDADVIGVGSSRDPAAPFLDTVTVQGQAVVPLDLVNIGHWLRLLLGAPTTTGTSPNFVHSFGSGAAALPSNSVEIGYPDVPSYDLCTGVRADTLELDFSPTGPATATFGLMGQGSTRGGTSAGGTPTSAAYTAFHKAQGAISRNGAALAQVTGARLTYANGMEMVRTIRADRKVEGVDPGIARATGQITARFADSTLLTQAQDNAPAEFAFSYTIDANR
ncbi:phage tail tube protein, partial [Rubritepida flocculans]|uniref:phage tail tube protein n=1 Tax=Rubritepida flocculans TaxID=182403 RepID=UPI00056B8FA6